MAEYKTMRKDSSDEFTEKKSRFIGYVRPVSSESDAINFINEIRAKHRDATHNVFAYSIRDNQIKRASDDGEPQGTAGVPILGVIEKKQLCDICIVVTRYFGGILLGTGGLSRAYSDAASLAISAGEIVKMAQSCDLLVKCEYSDYGGLDRYISENCLFVVRSNYEEKVSVVIRIKAEKEKDVISDITDITCGKAGISKIAEGWNEI